LHIVAFSCINSVITCVPGEQLLAYITDSRVEIAVVDLRPEISVEIFINRRVVPKTDDSATGNQPAPALLCDQQEQHSVIQFRVAYAPVIEEAHRVFVRVHTIQIFDRDYNDLRAPAFVHQIDIGVDNVVFGFFCQYAGRVGDKEVFTLLNKR